MRKQIETDGAPKATSILSQAIESNGFIFVSGQIHQTLEGEVTGGSVADKVAQIMLNIGTVLMVAGASLKDVVKATIYVTDMHQMIELNTTYPNYFIDPLPALEAVCVKSLPLGATIEISVIAAKP